MKKAFLLLITILLFQPGGVFSQSMKGQSEISGSIGFITTDEVANVLVDGLVYVFTLGTTPHKTDRKFTDALFLTYRYHITNNFSLGASLGIDNERGKYESYDSVIVGNYNRKATTIAIEACYNYINKKTFRLYGFAGLGGTFVSQQDNYDPNYSTTSTGSYKSSHVNVQFTPLGIRVGNMVSGFLEFGFGYKGVINFGLSGKF